MQGVFRHWLPHASLGYLSATGENGWSEPTTLVHGANPRGQKEYGIFYHCLFMDRAGALYLRFSFFEFRTGAEGQYPRVLAMSEDSGQSWRLATTAEMQRRVR